MEESVPLVRFFVNDRFYRVDDSYIYYAYLCGPLMVLLLCGGFALLTWEIDAIRQAGAGYLRDDLCLLCGHGTLPFHHQFLTAAAAGAAVWRGGAALAHRE